MSQINMAAINGANGSVANMPLMNNGANGTTPRPGGEIEEMDYDARLNAYIYDYLIRSGQFDTARALYESKAQMNPALKGTDGDANGSDEDSKDDAGPKRPAGLPAPNTSTGSEGQGGPFLLEWFSLFWDVFHAQRKRPSASAQAMQYVQHTQVCFVDSEPVELVLTSTCRHSQGFEQTNKANYYAMGCLGWSQLTIR